MLERLFLLVRQKQTVQRQVQKLLRLLKQQDQAQKLLRLLKQQDQVQKPLRPLKQQDQEQKFRLWTRVD